MTEVIAQLRFLRQGPRKVRLVADLIRNRPATRAREILLTVSKQAARPLLKLLDSALANAKHNFKIEESSLKIGRLTVDGGPMLKRWQPKAHGRATPIRERTSHIKLVLVELPVKEKKTTKKLLKDTKIRNK